MDKHKVPFLRRMVKGKVRNIPQEVHMLCKAGAGPGSSRSKITPRLLDWYDTGSKIHLVLERPEPCCDLAHYTTRRRRLPLKKAKVCVKLL